MTDSNYDVAQICTNGHVITSMLSYSPHSSEKYCSECGALTIISCPSCQNPIRGYYNDSAMIGLFDYQRPLYCHNCGDAFPWTAKSLEAASEFTNELNELTSEEKQQLKDSLPDLIQNTPKSIIAESRFKKLMKKLGKESYDGLKAILIDIVGETVKKSMFGS